MYVTLTFKDVEYFEYLVGVFFSMLVQKHIS